MFGAIALCAVLASCQKENGVVVEAPAEEAVDLSLRYCRENHIETNRAHQSMMLDEYLRLQCDPQTGRVDYSKVAEPVFNDIVGALLNTGYITNWVQYNETIK